ncbi:hypothetical protein LOB99_02190 [Lactobacillus delbrueckii subsp. lactis]|nr:hypothetical protein [Lactobacillus delbrueckii]MCD5441739.1 hypothetical protein [Lactobacillus delbrueckii subsp. lactis]
MFSTIFVNGEFGDDLIRDTLMDLGHTKLREQYQRDLDPELEKWLIALNWIIVNGLAVMLVDGLIDYDQDNFVRIIKRQLESLFDR